MDLTDIDPFSGEPLYDDPPAGPQSKLALDTQKIAHLRAWLNEPLPVPTTGETSPRVNDISLLQISKWISYDQSNLRKFISGSQKRLGPNHDARFSDLVSILEARYGYKPLSNDHALL